MAKKTDWKRRNDNWKDSRPIKKDFERTFPWMPKDK
jgi:hypothetical protein